MKDWLPGALGFATLLALVLAALLWIGSRRLLASPVPASPLSAVLDGWRAVFRTIEVLPLIALLIFVAKLLQIFAYSGRDFLFGRSLPLRLWSGVGIEFAFTLTWAVVAFQIHMLVLIPDEIRQHARQRTPIAVVYAFIFWFVAFILSLGGVLWISALHGRARPIVGFGVFYMPYIFIIASALTRPGIAIGLPRPFAECRRMLRENWFGVAMTLGLAALPLGLLYLGVGLVRRFVPMPISLALALEVPVAFLSACFYAAFEGAIAEMYKRIQ